MASHECADPLQVTSMVQRYLNTKQAAAHLGLSTQYLEIARHKGGGPQYIKLAKAVRYRAEDLDAWMAIHIQKHTAETRSRGGQNG
jgi:predicted DNA-binding transcriptional regulator AlpA